MQNVGDAAPVLRDSQHEDHHTCPDKSEDIECLNIVPSSVCTNMSPFASALSEQLRKEHIVASQTNGNVTLNWFKKLVRIGARFTHRPPLRDWHCYFYFHILLIYKNKKQFEFCFYFLCLEEVLQYAFKCSNKRQQILIG